MRTGTPAQSDARHPWGYISYLDYRYKVEFGQKITRRLTATAKSWASLAGFLLGYPSVEFMEQFNPPAHKIPSALLTDHALLRAYRATGRPLILSTGMSTLEEIKESVALVGEENLILCHTTSSYPCPPDELNLRMIQPLRGMFSCPIGYSGHEVGLVPSAVAVALGACLVDATSRWTAPCGAATIGFRGTARHRAPGEVHPRHRTGAWRWCQTCL
jgi:N-acetylneuraminate synthase